MSTTWHARTTDGDTIFIRRASGIQHVPVYEIHRYSGDIAVDPSEQPVPDTVPDELESRDRAIELVHEIWNIEKILRSPGENPRLTIDFESMLKTSLAIPLYVGLHADELSSLLGLPDAVGQSASGGVWWMYGSVLLHIFNQQLLSLEIDRGGEEFTTIRFSNWFLERTSTPSDVESELLKRAIEFSSRHVGTQTILITAVRDEARCVIDFDDRRVLHAFYWGKIDLVTHLEGTQRL